MKVADIIAKLKAGEELSDEESKFIETVDSAEPKKEVDVEGAIKSRLARERKKSEAEKNELLARMEELEEKLAEANEDDSKTALEKAEAKMARLEEKLTAKEEAIKQREQDLYNSNRNSAINQLKSQLNTVSHCDDAFLDFQLNQMTKDMDHEEILSGLDDIKGQFVESHPSLIKAEGSGTGIRSNTSETPNARTKFTLDDIKNMSADEFLANESAIESALKNDQIS